MRGAFSRRPFHPANRGRVEAAIGDTTPAPPDVIAPVLLGAVILASGTALAMTYDETLNAGSVPLPAAFALAGTPRTVTGVAVAGGTVLLSLSGPVTPGAVVTLNYTAGAAPIEDGSGNNAANLVAQPVTNNSAADVVPPTVTSATVPASGLSLTLVYNELLDAGSVPAPGAYALSGTAAVVTAVNVTGTSVVLTLAPAVLVGAVVTLAYTPGGAPVQDTAGNDAAALVAQAVTNNSTATPGDVTAPTLVSAIIPAAGTSLALTYNEALDAGSVPALGAYALSGTAAAVTAVGIAGAVVTLTLSPAVLAGEVVTVSYTAGGAPVQDAAGNDAANLVAQATTNNSTVVGGVGPLDPLTIVTSRVWQMFFSGDAGVTLGVGAGVALWADQSGNGKDFSQPTGTAQPVHNAADPDFGGRGSLAGDGLTKCLISTLWDPLPPLTQPYWFFVVFRPVAWTSGRYLWNGGAATSMYFAQIGVTPAMAQNNTAAVNSNTGATLGASCRGEVYFSGSTADYIKLAATTVTGASAGNANSAALVGFLGRSSGAACVNGKAACWGVTLGEPTPYAAPPG